MTPADALRAALARSRADLRALVPVTPATVVAHADLDAALRRLALAAGAYPVERVLHRVQRDPDADPRTERCDGGALPADTRAGD